MKNLANMQQYERTIAAAQESISDAVHPFAFDRISGFPGTVRTRCACR
ncbi:hypothetical protein ACFFSY_16540 [Paenibacillus aurantiacus]|uniref:Uncharacterized protein n=1 Tax=Paenibacillus aurantiacus TaxID=1936118 RepID=A0ABV5KRN4_9BACL